MIHLAIASLDGYVADEEGRFDWAAPDEEVHAFVNDLVRPVGTHLYGRRMYETMAAWETMDTEGQDSPAVADFAELWRAADKVVYSGTLESVSSERTRLEREFEPAAVRRLEDAAEGEVAVGGSELGGQALAAGLVDDLHLILAPILVGGGKPALPAGVRLGLELRDQRRFGNGMVYLRYEVESAG